MEPSVHSRRGAWARLADRCRAAPRLLRARREARVAAREERRALSALGDALAAAAAAGAGADAARAREEIAALDALRDRLGTSLSASLGDDRADYAAVSPWVRPLVIGRGLAARLVLRHRLGRVRRDREASCARLAAAALGDAAELPGGAARLASAAMDARARVAAAAREEESLLSPLGGGLLPGPVRLVSGEAVAFGRALAREARAQLVPRVPALFGLAAGWWVSTTFTDSRFMATLHSLGIGEGPRVAVDGDTLQVYRYGAPLLAAALCSYASSRLASLVRTRYGAAGPGAPPAPGLATAGRAVPGPDPRQA